MCKCVYVVWYVCGVFVAYMHVCECMCVRVSVCVVCGVGILTKVIGEKIG